MFIQRRKKRIDEEGDEDLPPKNRPFKLKTARPDPPPEPTPPPAPRPKPAPKPKPQPTPVPKPLAMLNDEEGLDRAYASDTNLYLDDAGTLFVSGSKGGPLDNDWMENYRDFGGGLLKKFETTAEKLQQEMLLEPSRRWRILHSSMLVRRPDTKRLMPS